MPQKIVPSVFHLATTTMVADGLQNYLEHVGAGDWTTDAADDHSYLVEVAGRSCYRSFGAGLNKNVTRVREGNANYVGNGILAAKHGSVLEHAYDTFALCDVSRILTHELVRHRAGVAVSQESGRYVRVDSIKYYYPESLKKDFLAQIADEIGREPRDLFEDVEEVFDGMFDTLERAVSILENDILRLSKIKNFDAKKKLQSAIRRLAPNGMATSIIVTANHRAWRHITSMRTASAAEEEIRLVQYLLFERLRDLHPAIYQDAVVEYDEAALPVVVPTVRFLSEKA